MTTNRTLAHTFAGAWLLAAFALQAQEPSPPPPAAASDQAEAAPEQAPGRFRLGWLYLTPYVEIGSLGFDTNVLYAPTQRQADFTIDGGPGLELIAPIRRASRLTLDGGVKYLYFARTESQRRLNGYALGRLEYNPTLLAVEAEPSVDVYRPPTAAGIEESFEETNGRINLEVDERVPRRDEGTRAWFEHPLFGRLAIEATARRSHHEVLEPADYLGADIRAKYNRDERGVGGGLRYYATIKTALAIKSEYATYRFPLEPGRDANTLKAVAGIETDTTALISGHALAGYQWFDPQTDGQETRRVPEVDVDATVNFSPRTRVGLAHVSTLTYSYLSASGEIPTLLRWTTEARLEKELGTRYDVRLFARHVRFENDGLIRVTLPDGTVVEELRKDSGWQLGANLGGRLTSRVRLGAECSYTDRNSNIEYFGVQGLLVGLTVDYITPISGRRGGGSGARY